MFRTVFMCVGRNRAHEVNMRIPLSQGRDIMKKVWGRKKILLFKLPNLLNFIIPT